MNTLKKTNKHGTIGAWSYDQNDNVQCIGLGVVIGEVGRKKIDGIVFLEEVDGKLQLEIDTDKIKKYGIEIFKPEEDDTNE